jgi:hypothetical protein
LFASLEGNGRVGLRKNEGASKKIEVKGFIGFIFLHNTKLSLFGESKNCIGGGFLWVFECLHQFFKFNLCSYCIFKIKNILIISNDLSFS